MKPQLIALAIASILTLSGCGEGGDEPTARKSSPSASASMSGPAKDVRYSTVSALKDAAVAAGYVCTNWEQDNVVDLAAESGHCSDEDVLSTFATESDLESQLEVSKGTDELLKEAGVATVPTLVGPNWMIHGLGADGLADDLGGTVYTPE